VEIETCRDVSPSRAEGDLEDLEDFEDPRGIALCVILHVVQFTNWHDGGFVTRRPLAVPLSFSLSSLMRALADASIRSTDGLAADEKFRPRVARG